jgi:excisionase family DNA binding protein
MNKSKTAEPERVLQTIKHTMEQLDLSKSTVYDLINSGKLQTVKFGRNRRVIVASVEEYIASLKEL